MTSWFALDAVDPGPALFSCHAVVRPYQACAEHHWAPVRHDLV